MAEDNSTPAESEPQYTPMPGEAQLTTRAIIAGCLAGGIVACTNIYMGLKIGWSFGASIIAAVLSYAFFAVLGKRLSVLETNIAQTAGAAAGGMASAAGLISAIPALMLLGKELNANAFIAWSRNFSLLHTNIASTSAAAASGMTSAVGLMEKVPMIRSLDWTTLVMWALAVSFLGVFFAVPLRRQYIEVDKLRFPTGTATAGTIIAMNSDSGDAIAQAKSLIWTTIAAGVFSFAAFFVPQLETPPFHEWLPIPALVVAAAWGFTLYLGPSLFGAGFLMGPRVVLSLMFGALLSWGVIGPLVREAGWATGGIQKFDGARGWILWPGVALMVSEALTALALSWRTFIRAFTYSSNRDENSTVDAERIPNSWWLGGLVIGSIITVVISSTVFNIQWWETLVAISLSAVLAAVAARSMGETDINPIGGVGKVTQLVFGAISPKNMVTNLMSAAITSGGASQAGEMLQDLKTGHLLGASPRKQLVAQLIGVCAGVFFVVPVYLVFTAAYELGTPAVPAPAAFAWKAVAQLLADGVQALPPHATKAVAIAAAFGIILPILRRFESIKTYVPSGLAMGIAFIIPASNSMVMFFGLLVWLAWKAMWPAANEKYTFVVASGLLAGEGLIGILKAVMTLAGMEPLFPME